MCVYMVCVREKERGSEIAMQGYQANSAPMQDRAKANARKELNSAAGMKSNIHGVKVANPIAGQRIEVVEGRRKKR